MEEEVKDTVEQIKDGDDEGEITENEDEQIPEPIRNLREENEPPKELVVS